VALDHDAYTSIAAPMVITVTDLDMAAPSLTVGVSTTTYTTPVNVVLLPVAGSYGTYTKSVYFTAEDRMTLADTIHVKSGDVVTVTYADQIPAGSDVSKTATWNGTVGTVTVAPAAVTGLKSPMTITVADVDVAASSVTVKVTSLKDATGINVVLNPVAGTAGSYSGQVGFSLKASTAGSVIAVQPNDQVTVSYEDIAPAATRTAPAPATWTGASATLAVDSTATGYHGTAGKMTISLADENIADSTVVVNVKSTKDTVGIPVTLTGSNFAFSGQVGFSMAASSASEIAVKDSGAVTVSIVDPAGQTGTATATWYSLLKPAVGLFGSNITDASTLIPGLILQLIPWTANGAATCTFDLVDSLGEDGVSKAVAITGTGGWAGFGWAAVTVAGSGTLSTVNMTAYAACTLHVSIKSTAAGFNLLVENLDKKGTVSTGNQTWVSAGDYGYLPDGLWHDIAIPLSAWTGTCDLSDVAYFLGVSMAPYVVGETMVIDNLYWTLP
jgi:hypothetical protein